MSDPEIVAFVPGLDALADHELREHAFKLRRLIPGSHLQQMRGSAWSSGKLTAQEWRLQSMSALDYAVDVATEGNYPDRRYWFTILEQGGEIDWHDHSQAQSALIYWPGIQAEEFEFIGGQVEFEKPPLLVRPLPGRMVFFRSTRPHRVLQHQGGPPRVSISANLSGKFP